MGADRRSGWPATCAPTSCTRPSTSTSCWPAGTPTALRAAIDESIDALGHGRRPADLGAVATTTSPGTSPGSAAASVGPRRAPGGRAADAGPARRRLRLPGRGARPAGGHRPARRAAPGPAFARTEAPGRARRLPGAHPLGRRARHRSASGPAGEPGCRSRPTGRRSPSSAQSRRPGLDAGAVPAPPCGSAGSTRRWATAR